MTHLLSDFDLHLLAEGTHYRNYEKLGAHCLEADGIPGVRFAVWAPNASRVSVIGDFNGWDPEAHVDEQSDARRRGMGGLDPGAWARRAVQVPRGRARWAVPGRQGRPLWLRRRDPAVDRIEGGPARWLCLGRRRLDGGPRRRPAARRADVHIRGAPGLVAPRPRRGQPLAQLPGAGRTAGRLRPRHGVHPRRAAAGDRAPVRRLVGLPDRGLLRPHQPVRRAAGVHAPGGHPAPAGHRRHPRLGAGPLPHRRARPGLFRRHPPVRARRPATRGPPRLGYADFQLRPPRGPQLSHQQRAVLAGALPHRRAAGGRGGLDASTSTTAGKRGSGFPTSTAAGRIWRRWTSSGCSTSGCTPTTPG